MCRLDDTWSEIDTEYPINAGQMDTFLRSLAFIEDSESNSVHSVTPGQNSSSISVFTDRDSVQEHFLFWKYFVARRKHKH